MDTFEHKSIKTKPFDLTYSYYLSPNFQKSLSPTTPTLLLNHGFPDDAFMWADAIPILRKLNFPMIIPDILGFGGSSKPTDPSKYNYLQQANSLAQILDAENVPNSVIPIGHDWGSAISQRFYLYHRTRCIGLCLLSLAYQVPSPDPFSLESANEATTKRFGYPQWEYWNFFTAPDAPKLMKENLGRFWEVNNGHYPSPLPEENGRDIWMREMFCTPDAMREYVTGTGRYEGYTVAMKQYPNGERLKERFIQRMQKDGLEAPVCYYHSLKENTMLEDERKLCEKAGKEGDLRRIEVPLLYIGQTGDWVCRTDLMSDAKEEGLVDDLEEKVVQAGHWCLYEKGEEIGEVIAEWLGRRFSAKT